MWLFLLAFLILVLMSQIGVGHIAVVNAAIPEVNSVKQLIQIRPGGLVVVNSLIDLVNEDSSPHTNFKIGLPNHFEHHLDDVFADNGRVVEKDRDNDILWIDVAFEPNESEQALNLSVVFVFSGLITYDKSNPAIYTVHFPECPTLLFDVPRL